MENHDDAPNGDLPSTEPCHEELKWHKRPLYRWIFVGLALFVCIIVGTVVGLVIRQSSTPKAPKQIACDFLSIPDLTTCQSTLDFSRDRYGSTIPSEIGLLTQLTFLSIYDNELKGTIPSEVGLLTQLMALVFNNNELVGTIPSEVGLLTQLTYLAIKDNKLVGTIPSEVGLLTQLKILRFRDNELVGTIPASLCTLPINIYIYCGEFTCASGCCKSEDGPFSCG